MKTTITLTTEELVKLVAKYLAGRVKPGGIECACGFLVTSSEEDLRKHLKHIFQWGLGENE